MFTSSSSTDIGVLRPFTKRQAGSNELRPFERVPNTTSGFAPEAARHTKPQ
jgi:hypothetical protein